MRRGIAGLLLALVPSGMGWAADPPPAATPPPAKQESVDYGSATSILGRKVIGPDGEQVGRISDVLVDDQGQPRAALIDIGGFMGIGQRRIAVAWRALHFAPTATDASIRIEMTIDQIADTPEWKPADRPDAPPATMAAPPKPAEPGK